VKVLGDVLPMTNSVFRAFRYAPAHPAFEGRDLSPAGTITERAAQGLDPRPQRRPPGRGGQPPDDRGPGGQSGQGRAGTGSGSVQFTDVHGAGSQRSDPKTGDPAAFPRGHGPQGDVIRINNDVRLVRGGLG